MKTEIIILIISLLGSGFFSACETAYNLANEGQLEKASEKGFINLLAFKIRQNYNFALSTILIGFELSLLTRWKKSPVLIPA
jgi:CBS domain containing-hemolysin-like protein